MLDIPVKIGNVCQDLNQVGTFKIPPIRAQMLWVRLTHSINMSVCLCAQDNTPTHPGNHNTVNNTTGIVRRPLNYTIYNHNMAFKTGYWFNY